MFGTNCAEEAPEGCWASRQVAPTSESEGVWLMPDGVGRVTKETTGKTNSDVLVWEQWWRT